jgi:hypothetical protein
LRLKTICRIKCGAISASLHKLFDADEFEFVHIAIMPERDPNEEDLEQVENATESEPAKSKDLLESEDLERKVVDSKKRITDENTSRPTS